MFWQFYRHTDYLNKTPARTAEYITYHEYKIYLI